MGDTNKHSDLSRIKNYMGEIAEMMLGGVLCAGCGEALSCAGEEDSCEELGIPMYCSVSCAKDHGGSKHQVCPH